MQEGTVDALSQQRQATRNYMLGATRTQTTYGRLAHLLKENGDE